MVGGMVEIIGVNGRDLLAYPELPRWQQRLTAFLWPEVVIRAWRWA